MTTRRQLLAGAGGMAVALAIPPASRAMPRPFLSSESGRLRSVLVHPASAADHGDCAVMASDDPFWRESVADIVAQHAAMVQQLQSAGARVLRLEQLLDGALEAARRQGKLAHDAADSCAMLSNGQAAMHGLGYLRDFAVMLPTGLMLGHVADAGRARQQALFRFIVAHAPEFHGYPVVFDASAAGLSAEGGDIQVLDERTLLVGVGNHTEARVATVLAQRTGMDIIAVNIRNADPARWRLDHDPLRDFFLHLNTSAAQIAPGHMLVQPWLFEAEHTSRAALKRPDPLVAEFGTITEFRAWSGERVTTAPGPKLVDHLRARGMHISFAGSATREEFVTWVDAAARTGAIFPRRERQATNLLATAPGSLVAFAGAEQTHFRLHADGARVHVVAGSELWRGYGGPNCLCLPLERG